MAAVKFAGLLYAFTLPPFPLSLDFVRIPSSLVRPSSFFALGLASAPARRSWKCTLQGFGRVYFALVEFALVTAVTLTCYIMIVKRNFSIQEARTLLVFVLLQYSSSASF